MRKVLTIIGLLAIVIGAVSLIFNLRLPHDTYLWREIQNSGHTRLFGVVALALLGLSTSLFPRLTSKRLRLYLLAFLLAAFVGGAVEIAQLWTPGDPDLGDFLRDVGGELSFLGFFMVFDRQLASLWIRKRWLKAMPLVMSIIVLAAALWPVGSLAWSYYDRNRDFPQLLNLESFWTDSFIKTRNAEYARTKPPDGWSEAKGRQVAEITFMPANYPTLYIEEPYSNWLGYSRLGFNIYSQQDTSVKLTLTVEDFHHDNSFGDRFNYGFLVKPGLNNIVISLDNIKNAPAKRQMDMKAIRAIHLFAYKPARAFSIYLDNMRLE